MTSAEPAAGPVPATLAAGAAQNALLIDLAGWLAASAALSGASSAATLPASLVDRIVKSGVRRRAARAALRMATSIPLPGLDSAGVAARNTFRDEPYWRAAYALAAAGRLSKTLLARAATPDRAPVDLPRVPAPVGTAGSPAADAEIRALHGERGNLRRHLDAQTNRARAAIAVDQVATDGPWLRWVATLDDRVTPDCLDLHGTVFHIDRPPRGLYPGGVHTLCRCYSVPAAAPVALRPVRPRPARPAAPARPVPTRPPAPAPAAAPKTWTTLEGAAKAARNRALVTKQTLYVSSTGPHRWVVTTSRPTREHVRIGPDGVLHRVSLSVVR